MEAKQIVNKGLTAEERNYLEGRASLPEEGIILLKEIPYPTVQSVDVLFDQIDILINDKDKFAMIIDLSEGTRPSAKVRRRINNRFRLITNRLIHCSYITTNPLLQVALRFIMFNSDLESYSIHSKWENALNTVKSEYEEQYI